MGLEGKKDPLVVRVHPDVAMYVLENEKDLLKKLEKAVGFGLELRDDPLLQAGRVQAGGEVGGPGRDAAVRRRVSAGAECQVDTTL